MKLRKRSRNIAASSRALVDAADIADGHLDTRDQRSGSLEEKLHKLGLAIPDGSNEGRDPVGRSLQVEESAGTQKELGDFDAAGLRGEVAASG